MISIKEKFNGTRRESGERPGREVEYFIRGSDDEEELQTGLENLAPREVWDERSRQVLVPINFRITEQIDTELWGGYVEYGPADLHPKDGDVSLTLETTGGTQKIYQSKRTRGRYGAIGKDGDGNDIQYVAPDLKGSIGNDGETVEGTEITVPIYKFTQTLTLADLTVPYKRILYYMAGRVNAKPFQHLDKGECLFLGAAGGKRGRGPWELTLHFAGNPNVTNLVIGDITVPEKRGWDYVWVRYVKKVEGSGSDKSIAMIPRHAYVEEVCDEGDFGLLLVGGVSQGFTTVPPNLNDLTEQSGGF